jgi:hypothetical protein
MSVKRQIKKQIRGWLPQEPLPQNYTTKAITVAKTKADLDKKLFKNGWIANSIIVSVFLGINFLLIRPHYDYNVNTEVTILFFGIFITTLSVVNLLIYWRYKKQLPVKEGQ